MAAEPVDHQISEASQDLWSGARSDSTAVFTGRFVPHPVDFVLDPPVPAPPREQYEGRGASTLDTGDRVLSFGGRLSTVRERMALSLTPARI